jgi:hypothetical protein
MLEDNPIIFGGGHINEFAVSLWVFSVLRVFKPKYSKIKGYSLYL